MPPTPLKKDLGKGRKIKDEIPVTEVGGLK